MVKMHSPSPSLNAIKHNISNVMAPAGVDMRHVSA